MSHAVDPKYAANLSAYIAVKSCFVCAGTGHAARDCSEFPCLVCTRPGHPMYRCFTLAENLRETLEQVVLRRARTAPPLPGYDYMPFLWHLLPLHVQRKMLNKQTTRERLLPLGINGSTPQQRDLGAAQSALTLAPPAFPTSASSAMLPTGPPTLPNPFAPLSLNFGSTPPSSGTAPSAGQPASLSTQLDDALSLVQRLRAAMAGGGGTQPAPSLGGGGLRQSPPTPSLPAPAPSAPPADTHYSQFKPSRRGGWVWGDLLDFIQAVLALGAQAPTDPFPTGSFRTGDKADMFKFICAAAHASPAKGAYASHIYALLILFVNGGAYANSVYEGSLPRGQLADPRVYARSLETSYFRTTPPFESAAITGSSLWHPLSRLLNTCSAHRPAGDSYVAALTRALEARVRPPPLASPQLPRRSAPSSPALEARVSPTRRAPPRALLPGASGGGGGGRAPPPPSPTPLAPTPMRPTRSRTGDTTQPESPLTGRGAPAPSLTRFQPAPTPLRPPRTLTGDTTAPESPLQPLRPWKRDAPLSPPPSPYLLQRRPPQPGAAAGAPPQAPHSSTQPGAAQHLLQNFFSDSQDDYAAFPFAQKK